MKNFIAFILTIAALISVKNAVAISNHELMTEDGNIWEILDDLTEGNNYTIFFDTNGNNNIYDDIILRVI